MPPRWVCLGIVAFWLVANGWLFWNDLWPQLEPGQPPAFEIDLVQEVQAARPPVLWTVWQGVGKDRRKVFKGETRTRHPQRGVYELVATYTTPGGYHEARVSGWTVRRMRSRYTVNEKGELLGLAVDVEGPLLGFETSVHIRGEVRGGKLAPELRANVGTREVNARLPEVEVARNGSVLLPLHPVDRLRGLRPGQSWRMPALDPLKDSLGGLKALGLPEEPSVIRARVRPQPELLTEERYVAVPCLVVDYESEDLTVHTWVQQGTGLVLKQEGKVGNDTWVIVRQ
jgi:hypothetical protein